MTLLGFDAEKRGVDELLDAQATIPRYERETIRAAGVILLDALRR